MPIDPRLLEYGAVSVAAIAIVGIIYIVRYFIKYIEERDIWREKTEDKFSVLVREVIVSNNKVGKSIDENTRYLKNRNGHLELVLKECGVKVKEEE